jgi:hypothetical protein
MLLRAINWAQPDDPEKKYPHLGRMRYVWMDSEYNIKLLLKDGATSWSEQKDEIMTQIKGHETLVDVHPLERDPVYLVATFKPVMETTYDRSIPIQELLDNITMFDETAMLKGWPSLFTDPFTLFDIAMEKLTKGEMSPRMEKFAESLSTMLGDVQAQDELKTIVTDSGIGGFEPDGVRILSVDPSGEVEDKTEEFLDKKDEGNNEK